MDKLNVLLSELNRASKGRVIKFRIYDTDEFRSQPISKLLLSNRSKNAFLRNGVKTLGDLVDRWGDLNHFKGLGSKSVQEIRYALCAYQYQIIAPNKQDDYLKDIITLNK